MRPSEAFDKVLQTVRQFQANQQRIPAVPLSRESSGGPQRIGNWRTEFIAEFALCGKQALKPWPKRAEMFQLYYLGGIPYTAAIELLQIESYTFDWWAREIKKAVGRELLRRGLHKTQRYPEKEGQKTTDLTEEIL